MVSLKYADYAGWSQALWVQKGDLALILTPQVGGRVMGVQWRSHDLYWVNSELAGRFVDVAAIKQPEIAKKTLGFLLWGGNKTWLAPQEHWIDSLPFLDLDSGAYQVAVDTVSDQAVRIVMTSPICRKTGTQLQRIIQLGDTDHHWSITHRLENQGDDIIQWGLWGNSMVQRPATVFLPIGTQSQFPRGVKTFANEGMAAAVRDNVVRWMDDTVSVQCTEPIKFKYGVDAPLGAILAILSTPQGTLGYLKQFSITSAATYGHDCVAEVFNASDYPYLEMEIHGPVQFLAPGESCELVVHHRLIELESASISDQEARDLLYQ